MHTPRMQSGIELLSLPGSGSSDAPADERDTTGDLGMFQNLGHALRTIADRDPGKTALLSSAFEPLSYGDLRRQIDEIGLQLRQAGFDRNARIGIALPSGPEAVLAVVAVACHAVAVPVDPKLLPTEVDQRLGILHLSAVVLPPGGQSPLRNVAERHGVAVIEALPLEEGKLGLRLDVPHEGLLPSSREEPGPDSIAFILQSSGTTALPKLIPFSHRNMLAAAQRMGTWFQLTPQDRCLSVSPPYYSHGLKVTVFTPLLTGGSLALPTSSTALDFPEWFDFLRPTWYSAGPTLHRFVLETARQTPDADVMHTLRLIISGGAPLPAEVRDGLQDVLGVPVLEHYGSSEAAQMAANLPGHTKPGTCGRPWPGTLRIVDDEGRELPAGMKGEILVGGPTLTSGYLDDPELNRAVFVDGWLRTGDIGSLDHDGFLTLHGRTKELINRGGEKIAPPEIDAALLRHPAVAEAAAFGVPHPRLGEDVAAAVVLWPGASATSAEIRSFLSGQVAAFKIPKRILILDQLPKGVTGKVLRRRLTEMSAAPQVEALENTP
jgi:acyl-CoA synthetase (AMP-forming)/AMP-acid ligase II